MVPIFHCLIVLQIHWYVRVVDLIPMTLTGDIMTVSHVTLESLPDSRRTYGVGVTVSGYVYG